MTKVLYTPRMSCDNLRLPVDVSTVAKRLWSLAPGNTKYTAAAAEFVRRVNGLDGPPATTHNGG